LVAIPITAQAHAQLMRSKPVNGSALDRSPRQIEVWFSELLEDGFNVMQVFAVKPSEAGQHADLVKGKPRLDGKDRTHLMVDVPPLAAGEYIVQWRVLSRDGHSAPGRIRFRVLNP
jgi:methionine-rich copper-binding protein CopC